MQLFKVNKCSQAATYAEGTRKQGKIPQSQLGIDLRTCSLHITQMY